MITIIGEHDLWQEMLALQTVRVWTSQATEQLSRMEFWSTVLQVVLTKDGSILEVLMDRPSSIEGGRLIQAFLKDEVGVWNQLDLMMGMISGPDASLMNI